MNTGTVVVLIIVVAAVIFALRSIVRGRGGCGCGSCSGCKAYGAGCSSCSRASCCDANAHGGCQSNHDGDQSR